MTDAASDVVARAGWQAMRTAMVDADIPSLAARLADDLTLTHMSGRIQNRAEWLDDTGTSGLSYHAIRDVAVDLVDGSSELTVRTHTDATTWGRTWNLAAAPANRLQDHEP